MVATTDNIDPDGMKSQEALKRDQWRLIQQRRRMVRWRIERKEEMAAICEERQRLEKKLQRLLFSTRLPEQPAPQSMIEAFYQSTIEQAALIRENILLQDAIEHQVNLESKLQSDADKFLQELLEAPQVTTTVTQDNPGWWVYFPDGEPPFYFFPLTEAEYTEKLNHCEAEFAGRHPCTATIGNLFCWMVDYAPPIRQDSGTVMAHARFSRRIHYSLDDAFKFLLKKDTSQWPVIVSLRSWGRTQHGNAYCQQLQRFSKNERVVVCNVPGDVHLRYIALGHASYITQWNGKRVFSHRILIIDSEENARNREAEDPKGVQWILDGGEVCTLTEVDENTIDVVYDQWAECLTEVHGRDLYIDWIQFAIRLEQFISPSRMLRV